MEGKKLPDSSGKVPKSWVVYNFQIPVPVGDCSVHLLLTNGRVQNAFIMDGGKNSKSGKEVAHEMITKSLQSIEDILSKVEGYKADWTFQSWVVTHWDHDHYAGVVDFFMNQRSAFTIAKSGKDNPLSHIGKPLFGKIGNGAIKIESTKGQPSTAYLSGSPKLGKSRSYFADKVTLMCGARPPDEKWDHSLRQTLVK